MDEEMENYNKMKLEMQENVMPSALVAEFI